jgi:hypothetical protein
LDTIEKPRQSQFDLGFDDLSSRVKVSFRPSWRSISALSSAFAALASGTDVAVVVGWSAATLATWRFRG